MTGLPAMLGIEFSPTHRIVFLFYLILALALLTNWVTIRLRRLPIGRAWEALARGRGRLPRARHQHHHDQADRVCDRARCSAVCRRVLRDHDKASSARNPSPSMNRRWCWRSWCWAAWARNSASALAALAMIGGFELFRGLEQYRMLVFGMAMVLLMIWRPRGLIGHRAPTVFLKHSQAISSDLVKEGHG
jgi:branched-chain amino acid transport system permease protein